MVALEMGVSSETATGAAAVVVVVDMAARW